MAFLERGVLRAKGGTIKIGADVELNRGAADRLDIEDATQISGTANITGATRIGGALTLASTFTGAYGTAAAGGTPTALTANGQIALTHKAHIPYLTMRSGGTPYYIKLPTATDGTIAVQVGGTIGDS